MGSYRLPGSALFTRYVYNGLGQRVRKTDAGESSDIYYDESGNRLADQEWTQTCTGDPYIPANCTRTHKLRTEYVYLDGLPVVLARYVGSDPNAQLSYLETDHLGTPRVAIGVGTGAVQWRWDLLQTAFGDHAPISLAPGFELNTRYPGQYFDKESGLHYNYFRDYEAGTGRYIESDPIGLRAGLNRYSYVDADPLRTWDSLGLGEENGMICTPSGPAIRIGGDSSEGRCEQLRGCLEAHENCHVQDAICEKSITDQCLDPKNNNKLVKLPSWSYKQFTEVNGTQCQLDCLDAAILDPQQGCKPKLERERRKIQKQHDICKASSNPKQDCSFE